MREMADQLSLELVEKGLVCSQFVLDIGYDAENLSVPAQQRSYHVLPRPIATAGRFRPLPTAPLIFQSRLLPRAF